MDQLNDKLERLKEELTKFDNQLLVHQALQIEIKEEIKTTTFNDINIKKEFMDKLQAISIDCTNKSRGILKVYSHMSPNQVVLNKYNKVFKELLLLIILFYYRLLLIN
jgi:hypothetical protein